MILASHVIFSSYGFWLPNDPRGSWSDFVGSWELLRFGKATTVTTHRSLARVAHDRQLREAAKQALRYPPVTFTGTQALAVARGFIRAIENASYTIFACAILPEHVHLVLCRHARKPRKIVGHMKARATRELKARKLWPDPERPVWGIRAWAVYLDTSFDVRRAITYVGRNPEKEGKPLQRWSFVTPFEQ
jgi:REP element-mobilizing transposase RayT